jgi:hypothetical protein
MVGGLPAGAAQEPFSGLALLVHRIAGTRDIVWSVRDGEICGIQDEREQP